MAEGILGLPLSAQDVGQAGGVAGLDANSLLSGMVAVNSRNQWAAFTAYSPGDLVQWAGVSYIARTAFTSAATFTVSNWLAWGSAGDADLGYATREIDFAIPTNDANAHQIDGFSVTVPTSGRPIEVMLAVSHVLNSTNAGASRLSVVEDGVEKGAATAQQPTGMNGILLPLGPVFARSSPAAGSHTYTVNLTSWVTGGISTVRASADGGSYTPMKLRVREVGV